MNQTSHVRPCTPPSLPWPFSPCTHGLQRRSCGVGSRRHRPRHLAPVDPRSHHPTKLSQLRTWTPPPLLSTFCLPLPRSGSLVVWANADIGQGMWPLSGLRSVAGQLVVVGGVDGRSSLGTLQGLDSLTVGGHVY